MAGNSDQATVGKGRSCPQPFRQLIAVHPWQTEVKQRNLRPKRLGQRQGRLPVVGNLELMAVLGEQHGHQISRILLIVDDQHASQAR